jgi:phosphoribosylformylglycinamidine synthase
VYRQYDHQLFLNTVVGPGGDASVLRLHEAPPRALAISVDGAARFCALEPRTGGRLVVLEAARNVACTGATPKALVNCLNFGNPEHAEVMWQFSEVVDGMSEACLELGIPVIGGNVSFYNESRGADIDPTPVVGVIGLIDELGDRPPAAVFERGDTVIVLGTTRPELGGSVWATQHGLRDGTPPAADLAVASRLDRLIAELVTERIPSGVHDCSDGGLAIALAEMAINGEVGFEVSIGDAVACFSESASRIVLSVGPDHVAAITARAQAAGVAVEVIGRVGGDRLIAAGAFDVSLADATRVYRDAIPAIMNAIRV